MKKILFIVSVLVAVSILTSNFSSVSAKNNEVTINVYNWGEFISDGSDGLLDVNKEFTKQTGIKVNYTSFANNESLFAKLQSGGTKYDVIIPSDYMVSKLIEKNMLRKLDFSTIPNYSFIDDEFKNPVYDPTNEYSVPYVWGTVSLIYNKKFIKEPEKNLSWSMLFDPKYKGQILMFDNPRDAFAIAQLNLGLDVNSPDLNDWNLALRALREQKNLVQAYVMDQIFDKMANEEAILAPYYTGDAVNLMKSNSNIGVAIPKEGTIKFVDAMCIPANSEHPEEAQQYINFLCRPDVAAANVLKIGYSSPENVVRAKLNLTEEQARLNYPSQDVLEKAQTFKSLPDEISEKLDNFWTFVKIGRVGSVSTLFWVLMLFLTTYVVLFVLKKFRAKY